MDISLLGIPLEAGNSVPGTLMGPAALRTAGIAAMLTGLGHAVRDYGDVVPAAAPADLSGQWPTCRNPGEIKAWTEAIHDRGLDVLRAGGVPIFMGGDHALSMGTVAAVSRHCRETGRDLAVLWLDAHADFNTPDTTPSGNMHGMPLAFLTGEPSLAGLLAGRDLVTLAPEAIHIFGLRSIDLDERMRLDEHGIDCIDMRAIDENGVSNLLRELLAKLDPERTHLHVSLDVDFIDPSLAPAVGTTVPGGATYREAHLIMEMLHDSGLVGSVDIVELNPFLDERGKSARLMAELAASLFGRTVLDRRPRPTA